jgi:hypothetical protein
LGAVEEAAAEAAKHGDRSEPMAALVAEARTLIEQARAVQVERAKVAAAGKAEAEVAAAAKRERLAALTLGMQRDALEVLQLQAELGSGSTPYPDEEDQCVVCFDAPKEYVIVPCGHQCVCGACAEQLTKTRTPTCPVCRGPIRETMKVFCS